MTELICGLMLLVSAFVFRAAQKKFKEAEKLFKESSKKLRNNTKIIRQNIRALRDGTDPIAEESGELNPLYFMEEK